MSAKIPPASAAWSLNFSLQILTIQLADASSEKLKLHTAEAGGIFLPIKHWVLARN